MSFDLPNWVAQHQNALDEWMLPLFSDAWPKGFAEAVRYPLFGGGKRVRPCLAFAAYRAIAPTGELSAVLPAGAAVELIHTYSLVHDDLPAMDDDDERRGKPTVHIAYDEPTAILAGDALLTEAFRLLAVQTQWSAETKGTLIARLATAAGYHGMIGGQVADIQGVSTLDELIALHRGKTGALIQASCFMGGVCANANPSQLEAIDNYGAAVGLAFQLADDVLDAEEDAGEDGPPSYVKFLGVDETSRRAVALADEAIEIAEQFEHGQALIALARFIVNRNH